MKRIDDADEIITEIRHERKADFVKRLSDWEKCLKEVREQRLQERKDERKAKRREEWIAVMICFLHLSHLKVSMKHHT